MLGRFLPLTTQAFLMCPILLKQNGTLIRRPRWRARACEMGVAGGARPRTWFAWLGTLYLSRRYGGSAPLPPGAARPLDSPHYTWGRMRRDSFFPLQTFRPAPRAGVGMVCGCGNAAFAALAGYVAHCASLCSHPAPRAKRSNARSAMSRAIRHRDDHLRHAERRKRQPPPTTRTKALFFGAPLLFLWARPKKWGGKGPQGPRPALA